MALISSVPFFSLFSNVGHAGRLGDAHGLPALVARRADHAGPDRVEFDIPVAGEVITGAAMLGGCASGRDRCDSQVAVRKI